MSLSLAVASHQLKAEPGCSAGRLICGNGKAGIRCLRKTGIATGNIGPVHPIWDIFKQIWRITKPDRLDRRLADTPSLNPFDPVSSKIHSREITAKHYSA